MNVALSRADAQGAEARAANIRDDFHRIVYAANADTARTAYAAFERTWNKRCPGVVTSLREGGDELLTFFRFPNAVENATNHEYD